MRPPVLIVLHGELSTPGRVGARSFASRGFPLDVRRPRFGDELPETLEAHSRRRHLRRPAERQRRRRVRPARDRLDRRAAQGEEAVSRHLPRRADAGQASRRPRLQASPTATPRSATTRSGRPPTAARSARIGPTMSINGTARASTCPTRRVMLAEGDSFPVQAFSYGGTAYALQFHMDVTHATMCRWTTRGHERMALPERQAARDPFRGPADARPGLPGVAVGVYRSLAEAAGAGKAPSAPSRPAEDLAAEARPRQWRRRSAPGCSKVSTR